MVAEPGPDERRVRFLLARLGARPLGHSHDTPQRAPMTDKPIIPTRIIPASAPLPARPPEAGEAPPWHAPRPPTPPTAAAPQEVVVKHIHEIMLVPAEPEPEPRWWERLWDRLVTWRMIVAVLAALIPWADGQSPVGIWSHTVHQARTEAGISAAYIIAGVAVGVAWALDRHTGRAVPRFLLVTASLGAFGVLHWWDPIQMLTGVTR